MFADFNRRYWHGRLPQHRVLRRDLTKHNLRGLCVGERRVILIEQTLKGDQLRRTLLHEMCHIGDHGANAHGPRFLRKVRRLGRLGETALEEDIEQYDGTETRRRLEAARSAGRLGPEQSWRSDVLSWLESVSLTDDYRRRWPTIRRTLARQFEVTESRIQRLGWAEREWGRLRAERYEDEQAKKRWGE
jgi:hypothetical protein